MEQGSGEPLVLLHGGMGDLLSWKAQLSAFARCYRVISYSRRYSYPNRNGFLASDYSAHLDAEDLAAFLEHVGLRKVHLVGTSYGAFAALALALKRRQLVQSLVLAEPPVHRLVPRAAYRRFMNDVWRPAKAAFDRGDVRCAMQALADGMWGSAAFRRPSRGTLPSMMRNARAMKALVCSSDAFPHLAPEKLKHLRVPVLLIGGEHTAAIHRLANCELARLLPRVRQETIPHASHRSPRENARAFNRAVLDFLEKT